MSEWWGIVVTNGLWIAGLSVVLAGFSYHDWLARASQRSHRDLFRLPAWQLPWRFGMCLACVGWGLSQTSRPWETFLWVLLGTWFAVNLIRLVARLPRSPNSRGPR